jgi:hypothetical protein
LQIPFPLLQSASDIQLKAFISAIKTPETAAPMERKDQVYPNNWKDNLNFWINPFAP